MPDTAAAQLRRILNIIPQLAEDREIPLREVASKVGVSADVLLKDLKSLTERFDSGGFSEGLSLFIEEECVSLNSNHFRRPMRLTRSELRALELGLAVLRAELPPDERSPIDSARRQIQNVVVQVPGESISEDSSYFVNSGTDGSEVLPVLRSAHAKHRQVRMRYRKGDSDEISERIVCPYSFVIANGRWYVIGYCNRSEGIRVFRLDRITDAATVDAEYSIPDSFKVAEFTAHGRAFSGSHDRTMTVRYSAKIADWIAEREEGTKNKDGSLVVIHPLADVEWAVRHLLQYGPEAEVLEPAEVRTAMISILDRTSSHLQ